MYRCAVCGNIVEVRHAGAGELVCCGRSMTLLRGNTEDASTEKHVPVIARDGEQIVVTVGSEPHPMTEEHYIEWISVVSENKTKTVYLSPGDRPEAIFDATPETITAYAYCNLHGMWSANA